MRVVFLVPWRTDDGPRAAAWSACKRRWRAFFPDWPIYEGVSPGGPFNRSAAINDAARQAGEWDVAVIIDADVMLPKANVRTAVDRAKRTGKVTWPHRRWRELKEDVTARLLGPKSDLYAPGILGDGGVEFGDLQHLDVGGKPVMDQMVASTTALSWSCCIAVRRDAWETIGGFDERFIGWGHEDSATAAVAGALVGWDRIEGDVVNLWHPRSVGNGMADRGANNRWTPQALANGRLGMRYMIALRRDYGLTDRPTPSNAEVIARDIRNLEREDAHFASQQTPEARKPFDGWWPSLEELRDSAVAYRAGHPHDAVTVIVTSGGSAENWPERRGYLRESLASLVANVSGPITQRVVYSDWPDEFRDELVGIAAEFGFYVVGGGHHGHTGMRQRMWRYLAKHAQGQYIFGAEDDFLYTRPVDLRPLIETLDANPHLAQVALLRAPAYETERQRGGILGHPVEEFAHVGQNGTSRLEHTRFWTNNPALYRKSLTATPWPASREDTGGRGSEVIFADSLRVNGGTRFAFWGSGEPWIEHIGTVRAGTGY